MQGNVEVWLVEVEKAMVESTKFVCFESFSDFHAKPRYVLAT